MSNIDSFVEKTYRSEYLEQELLACICKKKPLFINQVQPDWFSSIIHSNIVLVLKKINAVISKEALLVTLKSRKLIGKGELPLYTEALDNIYKINVVKFNDKSIEASINALIEMYEGRFILSGMKEIITNIKSFTVEDIKDKLKSLSVGVKRKEEIKGGNYTEGIEERISAILEKQELLKDGGTVGIPTGIRTFDAMIGGLVKPEFGVIAGQPGVGKSATLGSFALSAWRSNYNVLIVTGEMPKIDMEFRLDSDVVGIPATKFRFGNLSKAEMRKWREVIVEENNEHDNFLEIVSFPRNFTADDIEGYANQIQDHYEKNIDLICLDYLNIMNAVGSRLSAKDWQSQADVIWDIKSLCADLNKGTSLWTAGQIKDDAIDADVLSLEDLKYARAIAETAPVVVGLVRSQDDEAEQVIEMQVLKMRNAPLPKKAIILRPNLEYMRIHEEIVPTTKDLALMDLGVKPMPMKKRRNGKRGDD